MPSCGRERCWRRLRSGEGRGEVGGGGRRNYLCLVTLHCLDQNDFCIKLGSNESRYNISLTNCEGQSHKTMFTKKQITNYEEMGELELVNFILQGL